MTKTGRKKLDPSNERLRDLVKGAGLTQVAALTIFNKQIKVRPLAESSWKGYFCDPNTRRYRKFPEGHLEHAEKVLGPLQCD